MGLKRARPRGSAESRSGDEGGTCGVGLTRVVSAGTAA